MVTFRAKLAQGERGKISFELDDASAKWLRKLAAQDGWHVGQAMRMSVETEFGTWSEEARKFLHAVRDSIAKIQGDMSRENKDQLYESCKVECGVSGRSIDDMTKEQVNELIRQMLDWAFEAGVDLSRFSAEREALRRNLDEMA